jgi:methenyltetrahydromethanopterin cyclohydrolase
MRVRMRSRIRPDQRTIQMYAHCGVTRANVAAVVAPTASVGVARAAASAHDAASA